MNNLPADVQSLDTNQLLSMMSGTTATSSSEQESNDLLPLLRLNHQDEDDDGNELKKGTFFIAGKDIERVYAKEVTFRALGDFMQYLHYDQEKEGTVNRSIIHTVGQEPIDETGTVRCGRPEGKVFHAMEPKEKSKYTGITCFRYLYGMVSYTGQNGAGETVEVPETPVLFRVKGASFMSFTSEVVRPCAEQNVPFQNVPCTVTNERKKNGGVTYFVTHFAPDFTKKTELAPSDVEVMKHILTSIKSINDEVKRKYDASIKSRSSDVDDSNILDAVEVFAVVEE